MVSHSVILHFVRQITRKPTHQNCSRAHTESGIAFKINPTVPETDWRIAVDVIGSVSSRLYRTGPLLARAGEGAVYRVSGDASILLKIFDVLPSARAVEKLEILTAYTPKPDFVALPLETVLNVATRAVVGFVQPFFRRTVPITRAFDSTSRMRCGLPDHLGHQVTLCRFLGEAVARLHAANLVMGDVSDTNFLIGRDWLGRVTAVSVIDCNSLQISLRTNRGHEIFASGVATEAYAAPEVQSTDWSISPRTVFSDNFGLAVLCWLMLFNGSHPFAVASPRNVDVPPLGERIERRLFPFAPATPLPTGWTQLTLDPSLGILPNDLREMFFRTFSTDDPRDRPTADEWVRAFRNWESKPAPVLRHLGDWKRLLSNPLANAPVPIRRWGGRGLLLMGIGILAILFPRFQGSSLPAPESEETRPAMFQKASTTSKSARPRYVDRDVFPDDFLNPQPRTKE